MRTCKVEGCERRFEGLGYCSKHRRQFKKYGKIVRTRFDKNKFVMKKDYCEIYLYNYKGEFVTKCIIDKDDFILIESYKWHLFKSRYAATNVKKGIDRKGLLFMHNLIFPKKEGFIIDHINHNGLDNRKLNMRYCTHQQNMVNTRKLKSKTSKYKGVCWDKKSGKWVSVIAPNRKQIYIGSFKSEKEAALAYDGKAKEIFGGFAYLNFNNQLNLKEKRL